MSEQKNLNLLSSKKRMRVSELMCDISEKFHFHPARERIGISYYSVSLIHPTTYTEICKKKRRIKMPEEISREDEELLKAISNYHTLPQKEQKRLRPLLEKTIERHKHLKRCKETLRDYFQIVELNDWFQICVWRKVAEEDLEKIARGEKFTTFFSGHKCYECDGLDQNCERYTGFLLKRSDLQGE